MAHNKHNKAATAGIQTTTGGAGDSQLLITGNPSTFTIDTTFDGSLTIDDSNMIWSGNTTAAPSSTLWNTGITIGNTGSFTFDTNPYPAKIKVDNMELIMEVDGTIRAKVDGREVFSLNLKTGNAKKKKGYKMNAVANAFLLLLVDKYKDFMHWKMIEEL